VVVHAEEREISIELTSQPPDHELGAGNGALRGVDANPADLGAGGRQQAKEESRPASDVEDG